MSKFKPINHVNEAESNRKSALKYLEKLNATKLTKAQLKILGSVQIMLLGQGVQLELAKEKLSPEPLEHWSSPDGCHEDCPACAAEASDE